LTNRNQTSAAPRLFDADPRPITLFGDGRSPRFPPSHLITQNQGLHTWHRIAITHSTEISGSKSFTARDQRSASMFLCAL
jgi:hypothetical protein